VTLPAPAEIAEVRDRTHVMGQRANRWAPKGMREHLCHQQTFAPDAVTRAAFDDLIAVLDGHRPIGADGKHGEMHTDTCGCDLDA
jgi:hypothetical protein